MPIRSRNIRPYVLIPLALAWAACGGRIADQGGHNEPSDAEVVSEASIDATPPEPVTACGRRRSDPPMLRQRIASNVCAFHVSPCGQVVYKTNCQRQPMLEGQPEVTFGEVLIDGEREGRRALGKTTEEHLFADESHLWISSSRPEGVHPDPSAFRTDLFDLVSFKPIPERGFLGSAWFTVVGTDVVRDRWGHQDFLRESAAQGTIASVPEPRHIILSFQKDHHFVLTPSGSFLLRGNSVTRFPATPEGFESGSGYMSDDGVLLFASAGVVGLDFVGGRWTSPLATDDNGVWYPHADFFGDGRPHLTFPGTTRNLLVYLDGGSLRSFNVGLYGIAGFVDRNTFVHIERNSFGETDAHLVDASSQEEIAHWPTGKLRSSYGQLFYRESDSLLENPTYWRRGTNVRVVADYRAADGFSIPADIASGGMGRSGTVLRARTLTEDTLVLPNGDAFPLHKDGATLRAVELEGNHWLIASVVHTGYGFVEGPLRIELLNVAKRTLTPLGSVPFAARAERFDPERFDVTLDASVDRRRFTVAVGPSASRALWRGEIPSLEE